MVKNKMKKKILILIPRLGGGGAERVASIIANYLVEKYEVQITTLVSGKSFYSIRDSVKITSANYKINRNNKLVRRISMGKNFLRSIVFVRKTIKEDKPDIVLSFLKEMDTVTFLATRGLRGLKWVCSERNDPTTTSKLRQLFYKSIYQRSDIMVCQSQAMVEYYFNVKRKVIIPNPVDFNNYPEHVGEHTPPKIAAVGRLVPQKNFEMLIESFALISNKYPEVTATIYGEGPERKKLEALVINKKLENRVFLPGATCNVLEEIRDAAIFAFPTNYEGFPNALVEAIAMGIPVVSTDFATGVAKEIVDEDVGIIVPCGDTKAFAEAMDILLANPEKRAYIRNVSRKAVESFAVEKVIEKWNSLFESLTEDKKCQNL